MDKSNLALSDLVYFIQTDQDPQNPNNKIAHITNAIKPTKDNKNDYESNSSWIEVIVPKYDQRTFNTNYKNDVYDFERDSWIDPNDLRADTDISQTGKGIISNLQSEVNTNNINHTSSENNITNNIAPSLANNAVTSANKYTDNKTNNLSSQIVNNSNNFSSMASNASNQANSYTNTKVNDLQSQINNTNSSNANLKTDIDSHPTWNDENQTRNQINQTATDTLNQANAHADTNANGLQDQITQNKNDILFKGILTNNDDLNYQTHSGLWIFTGDSDPKNMPGFNGYGSVYIISADGGNTTMQIVYDHSGKIYNREYTWGTWSSWKLISNEDDINNLQSQITHNKNSILDKISDLQNQINNLKK